MERSVIFPIDSVSDYLHFIANSLIFFSQGWGPSLTSFAIHFAKNYSFFFKARFNALHCWRMEVSAIWHSSSTLTCFLSCSISKCQSSLVTPHFKSVQTFVIIFYRCLWFTGICCNGFTVNSTASNSPDVAHFFCTAERFWPSPVSFWSLVRWIHCFLKYEVETLTQSSTDFNFFSKLSFWQKKETGEDPFEDKSQRKGF